MIKWQEQKIGKGEMAKMTEKGMSKIVKRKSVKNGRKFENYENVILENISSSTRRMRVGVGKLCFRVCSSRQMLTFG